MVASLHDAILLRGVRSRQIMLHSELRAVCCEGPGSELASAIRPQRAQLAAGFRLGSRLEPDNGGCGLVLRREKGKPHVPRQLIDEQEEVFLPARSCRVDRPAEVDMDELELILRPELCLLRERSSPLLPC